MQPPPHTGPVRSTHRFDEAKLGRYLAERVDGLGATLTVQQFKGGQSNPTFWLTDGTRQLVLRKKPPGRLLPSAHAVEREHRVMHALASTDVPVPCVHHLCEDPAVIGTPFFVMDLVRGRVLHDVQLPGWAPEARAKLYEEKARILAALHQVDHRAVGLDDFGKASGYVARQVKRWSQQYQASRTDDIAEMEALMPWLAAHLPERDEVCLTHGDYRLDNIILHPTEPRALAVIDWELSTLGDPLCDLAYLCMLYDVSLPNVGGLAGVDHETTGIPAERALLERYCELTGRGPIDDWPYYKAFSLFRLAAIAQGVYKRSLQGNASSENAAMFGVYVRQLAAVACSLVGL